MSWPVVILGDLKSDEPRAITDGPFGSNLARRHYTTSGPRVIRLQNIGDGIFIDQKAHISPEHFQTLRAHEVRGGDLLVASLGDVMPRACLAPTWIGPAIVKADCIRVRLGDQVDPRWVLYSLQRPEARRWAAEHRHGVGRPRLGLNVIRQIPVPLPPLPEQHRIVGVLEDHFSRLEAGGLGIARSLKRLEVLREAALAHCVVRAKSAIGGQVVPLGNLGRVTTGTTPLKSKRAFYENGTVPWITSGDLHQGVITEASQFVTERALQETSLKLIPAGAILIAMYGEGRTRGTAAELAIEATTNQACAAIILNEPELRSWVRLMLDANYDAMRRMAAGGVQPNLNLSLVRAIGVPIPCTRVRDEISAQMAEIDVARLRLKQSLAVASARCASIRRALLSTAFSGRLTKSTSHSSELGVDA